MIPCLPRAVVYIVAFFTLSVLQGCATTSKPLYYWGSYQTQIYADFKGEKGPEEQIQALESDREKALAQGQALPPGFQAHLAMLYGRTGQSDRLVNNLEAEKAQYPESSNFIDFLLKKSDR